MRVVAWNVNRRKLDHRHVAAFRAFEADTILLNEFVDGKFRADFETALQRAGFPFQALSAGVEGKRAPLIFAASNQEFEVGDLEAPVVDEWSRCNFLHIQFGTVEMCGIRIPCYELNKKEEAAKIPVYWDRLGVLFEAIQDRRILFAGDFNTDPARVYGNQEQRMAIESHLGKMTIPSPEGSWSFRRGDSVSRIDHVAHTPLIEVRNPRYESRVGEHVLAGEPDAMSDHAALVFEVA